MEAECFFQSMHIVIHRIETRGDLFVNCRDQLRAEIQAMQQQLNEKDYELETHENEIESYKKELDSYKRRASEAACEAASAHAAEQAQYLEEKKSLDDFKRSVEKQRCLAQFLTDTASWSNDLTKIIVVANLDIWILFEFSAKVAMDTGARIPWGWKCKVICLLHFFFLPRVQNGLYQQLI